MAATLVSWIGHLVQHAQIPQDGHGPEASRRPCKQHKQHPCGNCGCHWGQSKAACPAHAFQVRQPAPQQCQVGKCRWHSKAADSPHSAHQHINAGLRDRATLLDITSRKLKQLTIDRFLHCSPL